MGIRTKLLGRVKDVTPGVKPQLVRISLSSKRQADRPTLIVAIGP